ncbi:hypothetical protein K438DRAFT_1944576 [Mycena galopus ATCC 62051]|nr:hypothetical protein K438DRAFT_1944576 [Mycena galopus ATCC 62051]
MRYQIFIVLSREKTERRINAGAIVRTSSGRMTCSQFSAIAGAFFGPWFCLCGRHLDNSPAVLSHATAEFTATESVLFVVRLLFRMVVKGLCGGAKKKAYALEFELQFTVTCYPRSVTNDLPFLVKIIYVRFPDGSVGSVGVSAFSALRLLRSSAFRSKFGPG